MRRNKDIDYAIRYFILVIAFALIMTFFGEYVLMGVKFLFGIVATLLTTAWGAIIGLPLAAWLIILLI